MSLMHPLGTSAVAHLQCLHCGYFSKSHSHLLTHLAEDHPTCLDDVPFGRLGNILMYQPEPRLFHCAPCFFTSRYFTKVFQHVMSKHCDSGADKEEDGGRVPPVVKEEPLNEEKGAGPKVETPKDDNTVHAGETKALDVDKVVQQEDVSGPMVQHAIQRNDDKVSTTPTLDSERPPPSDVSGKTDPTLETSKSLSNGVEKSDPSPTGDEIKAKSSATPLNGDEKSKWPLNNANKNILSFDGSVYRCLLCGWKNKVKAFGVNHVIRNHGIPRMYAMHAVQYDGGLPDDDDVAGLSAEMLKEEIEATAKVVTFDSGRFVCLICGWKTKLKGFAISHVIRFHDVELPYACKECSRRFFLPSRLQQHVRAEHRPGRYSCPFCCFRTNVLGGFKRHCSRCCAREGAEHGQGAVELGQGRVEPGERRVEPGEKRVGRKRRRTAKMMEAEGEEDED